MSPSTDTREAIFPDHKIRCLLVHDHVLLRQGLRRLLEDEPDIQVISEASNAAECLRKVHELRPDVLIADEATFGLPAAETRLCIERESSQIRIVFLETQQQAGVLVDRLHTMTENYVSRETSSDELVEMVRKACSRDPLGRSKPSSSAVPRPGPVVFSQERTLTAREREVLKLLAEGKTVRGVATVLGLSAKTVDAHKFNLMRKLGIHNKAELVMWAIRKQVVKIPVNF